MVTADEEEAAGLLVESKRRLGWPHFPSAVISEPPESVTWVTLVLTGVLNSWSWTQLNLSLPRSPLLTNKIANKNGRNYAIKYLESEFLITWASF